jgi:predicted DNA-binding protein with PD1-like motif
MKSIRKKNILLIRLDPDEDFLKSLKILCKKHKIKNAIILSAIGQLKKITLAYFDKNNRYITKDFLDAHELIHLSGNIIQNDNDFNFHIHTTISNDKMKSFGGHLMKAEVNITNEIFLLLTDINITRKIDDVTGLKKINFD